MEITGKLVATVVASLTLIFGAWFFIESRIDEKVDKELFTIKMELKDARLQNVEEVYSIKMAAIKEDVAELKTTVSAIDSKLDILLGADL